MSKPEVFTVDIPEPKPEVHGSGSVFPRYTMATQVIRLTDHEAARSADKARIAGLERDAARYRWMKENVKHEFYADQIVDLFTKSSAKIDALIDAALAQQGKEGGE